MGMLSRDMRTTHHDSLHVEDVPLPSDRSTGLVLAVACAGVAYLNRSGPVAILWLSGAVALVLAVASLVAPAALRPVTIAWMKFAHVLAKIFNPIVMFVLFAVLIVPLGLLASLVRDPLRKRRSGAQTYWVERREASDMRQQF